MSTANTLKIVSGAIGVLNGLINLFEDSQRYREMIANAISEGRELSPAELDTLEAEALAAIEEARRD